MISRYLVSNQQNYARGMILWAYVQAFGASLIVAIVSAVIAVNYFASETGTIRVYLLAFALLPVVCLTSVQRAILNALQLSALSLVPQDILRPGLMVAFLLAWLVFWPGSGGQPTVAMSLQLLAFFAAFFAGDFWLRRFGSRTLPQGPRSYEFGRWYRVSLQFITAGTAALVMSQTDILMLAWLEPPASAGLYRVGAAVALFVMFPFAAINVPLAPALARYYQQKNMDEFQRMVTLVVRWGFAGSLLLALIIFFTGKPLLNIVYGQEFVAAYSVVVVLASAQVFHAGAGPVSVILDMTGYQFLAAKGLLIAAVANVALNAALIPPFGPLGAAFATGASIILWNAILFYGVISKLKINPSIFGKKR